MSNDSSSNDKTVQHQAEQAPGLAILLSVMNEMDEEKEQPQQERPVVHSTISAGMYEQLTVEQTDEGCEHPQQEQEETVDEYAEDEGRENSLAKDLRILHENASNNEYCLSNVFWDSLIDYDDDINDDLSVEMAFDYLASLLPSVTEYTSCSDFLSIMEVIDGHATASERKSFRATLLGMCLIRSENYEIFQNMDYKMQDGRFRLRVEFEKAYMNRDVHEPLLNYENDSPTYGQQREALHQMYVKLGWE